MVQIPIDRLPASSAERHAALRDYFCDKDAQVQLIDGAWTLTLAWPGGERRHVDPKLQAALNWWGDGVKYETMALAQRRTGRTLSALYDTWTIYSWSEWLRRRPAQSPEHIVILHVDDHKDLAAPRLFVDGGIVRDGVTGSPFDLENPDSVREAILSGALGMGSFLTPLLHAVRTAEVRHLCQPPKASRTVDHRVHLTTQADTLLEPGRLRPAIHLEPAIGVIGKGTYRITPDVDAWLDQIGQGPVLLHIDMDYFNNRYDGDGDWIERQNLLDPPLEKILQKIDEMTEALRTADVGRRIEDIVIAYSPGFFPAEFWSPAEARLRPRLEQLHET